MFVVGIDGGGTKTRVAVCASDGTLLHRETLGAFNLSAIGEDGFRRRVGEILTLCGDMRACGALCVGGGHIIDDPGSGYALGRDALAAALQTEDGRLSENALHGAVMDTVGGSGIQGIFDFVYFSRRGKGDIAALAPLVLRCAAQGDAVSLDILRRGAAELARLVSAVMGKLGLENGSPCALAGGLLAEDNVYRRAVCAALAPFCRPAAPEHDALFGAVQLALAAIQ